MQTELDIGKIRAFLSKSVCYYDSEKGRATSRQPTQDLMVLNSNLPEKPDRKEADLKGQRFNRSQIQTDIQWNVKRSHTAEISAKKDPPL